MKYVLNGVGSVAVAVETVCGTLGITMVPPVGVTAELQDTRRATCM